MSTELSQAAPMSPFERRHHIRLLISRLEYHVETLRHLSAAVPTRLDGLVTKLTALVSKWHHTKNVRRGVAVAEKKQSVSEKTEHSKRQKKPKNDMIDCVTPQHFSAMLAASQQLKQAIMSALYDGKSEPVEVVPSNKDETAKTEFAQQFAMAQAWHIREAAESVLSDLIQLFQSDQPIPTRQGDWQSVLRRSVAHNIQENDTFHSVSLPNYLTEMRAEAAYPSAIVHFDRQNKSGLTVSIVPLDFAVGLYPLRSAWPAYHHFLRMTSELNHRVESELILVQRLFRHRSQLSAVDDGATSTVFRSVAEDMHDNTNYVLQAQALEEMKAAIDAAIAHVNELYSDFKRREEEWLHDFYDSEDPYTTADVLIQTKQLDLAEFIQTVQRTWAEVQIVALPFCSPAYCRSRRLSYTNPASIRHGILLNRYVNASTAERGSDNNSVFITSGCAKTHTSGAEVPEELIPSSKQLWFEFDKFPEMVGGARCALRNTMDATCANDTTTIGFHQLQEALEEQREFGGYFVHNGGERICRCLMMQRCNVPLNIQRESFANAGNNFSPKAVVIRSKRPSGLTTVGYFYYSTSGKIIYSFARRIIWQLPVSLLLFCCGDALSADTLYRALTTNTSTETHARVEAFLQHHRQASYGSLTGGPIEYLAVLGRKYRQYQQQVGADVGVNIAWLPHLGAGASSQKATPHKDAWYGLFVFRRHILPHLNEAGAETPDAPAHEALSPEWPGPDIRREMAKKFDAMIAIIRQLLSFVDGRTTRQGNDTPAFQEACGPNQVFISAFETSLIRYLKLAVRRFASAPTADHWQHWLNHPHDRRERLVMQLNNSFPMQDTCLTTFTRLLSTGNFAADRDEDFFMPQNSGWIVQAEHLNFFRFVEQLRTLHRGKRINEMRSSEVRKYPGEAYGFLCMVHSPDGEDCGIVNFMANCVSFAESDVQDTEGQIVLQYLCENFAGLKGESPNAFQMDGLPVWLEGQVAGYCSEQDAEVAVADLRRLKEERNLRNIEVVLIKPSVSYLPNSSNKQPPGLFIFYLNGRLMRPVQSLESHERLNIGTWENTTLHIAGGASEMVHALRDLKKGFEYAEIDGSGIVSLTSATIPYFHHNCSPRNLFQCGLSKQTAGTQLQAQSWRREAKLFRMPAPQAYLVRTSLMEEMKLDDFSLGVNAVVAVLANTGYDMDDAVIVNKSARERGLLDALVTITKVVDLTDERHKGSAEGVTVFRNIKDQTTGDELYSVNNLESVELLPNGMPPLRPFGAALMEGRDHSVPNLLPETPVYCYCRRYEREGVSNAEGSNYVYTKPKIARWKDFDKGENAWIHHVIPLQYNGPDIVKAAIVFRIPRSPTVGDKFSSRHGQKGTLPLHIASHDLPFSGQTGITPDIIINPHAFPSRMTLGMILEMLAGKAAALKGQYVDASPWAVVDDEPVMANAVGDGLEELGFCRHGREPLYCGQTGDAIEAEVFVGVCGYQRLRHQVNDKWQARARTDRHTHKAVTLTGQPVKGRKKHGGVRVGEMERDGLLSHGIADVVSDRLLHVSDGTKAYVCRRCGSLTAIVERAQNAFSTIKHCQFCGDVETDNDIKMITIPTVLRLWATELTGLGVRVALKVTEHL